MLAISSSVSPEIFAAVAGFRPSASTLRASWIVVSSRPRSRPSLADEAAGVENASLDEQGLLGARPSHDVDILLVHQSEKNSIFAILCY